MGKYRRLWNSVAVAVAMAWTMTAHASNLWSLASKGDLAGVKAAVAAGADVNAKYNYGDTPLYVATVKNHPGVVKYLLAHGANPNAKDAKFSRTALHLAAQLGHADIAKLFLAYGADVNARDKYGSTPLHLAAFDDPNIVKLLLAHAADPNAKDKYGDTPLYEAASNGRSVVVKLLLAHGANPNIKDKDGNTALSVAVDFGHSEVAKLLLAHGAKIYDENEMLRKASYVGDFNIVKYLLAHGTNPNSKDSFGITPLRAAVSYGHSEVAKLLLAHGAKIYDRDKMLLEAAKGGILWMIERVTEEKVALYIWDSALIESAIKGHSNIAEYLLARGANPNTKKYGDTPLYLAAENGHSNVVKLLLAYGAKIYDRDKMLRKAAKGGILWLVKEMLDQGADINAKDEYGDGTPLVRAAIAGNESVVKYLLAHGADPNPKTSFGKTTLYYAAFNHHTNIVKLLLAHGASAREKNAALHIAVKEDRADIVKLLLTHGARPNSQDLAAAGSPAIRVMIEEAMPKLQLFKADLLSATRTNFRKALKRAGAKPLREDNSYWYDKYDSSHLLTGTDILYAGYVAKTGSLAIVEYRFPTRMNAHKLMEVKDMLTSKYGPPVSSYGKPELGKASFGWDMGEVKIAIYRDWPDTTVYLDYIVKSAKKEMDREIAEFKRRQKNKQFKKESNAF